MAKMIKKRSKLNLESQFELNHLSNVLPTNETETVRCGWITTLRKSLSQWHNWQMKAVEVDGNTSQYSSYAVYTLWKPAYLLKLLSEICFGVHLL